MTNSKKIKESIRRLIKYSILLLIVAFSVKSIPSKCGIPNIEAFYIGIIAATVYALIDIISPSIVIKV